MLNSMGETREENGNLFFPNSSDPISINDLYPSTSGKTTLPANKFFHSEPDIEAAKGVYDSDKDMSKAGASQQEVLWKDAMSEEPSLYGTAYKMLLDQKSKSKPSFDNDPFMTQTKDVYDNIDVIAQGFGDCTVEHTFTENKFAIHMPKYDTCQRVEKPSGSCVLNHDVSFSTEEHVVQIASRGENFITVEYDLTTGGWETVHPSDGYNPVANIPKLEYDDFCGKGKPKFIVSAGVNYFWNGHGLPGSQDTTAYMRNLEMPTCENGLKGTVQVQDTKGGYDGGKYILSGGFRLDFLTLESESWSPPSCIDKARHAYDSVCESTVKVLDGAQTKEECATLGGINICPGSPVFELLEESPVSNLPKLAVSVAVDVSSCNFNVGEMDCWTDPQGVRHCPYNDGDILDNCSKFEDNSSCGFISSDCILKGDSSFCYATVEKWDCGGSVLASNIDKQTEYKCTGEIRCMGGDCLDIEQTQNGDFGKAAALLHAAQHMGGDLQCADKLEEGGGIDGPGSSGDLTQECTIFKGEDRWCKKALGGTVDCCETPDNVNFADYLTMITSVPKIDAAITSIKPGSMFDGVKSAYTYFRDPVVSSFQQSTGPLTSYVESITGTYDAVVQGAEQILNQLGEKVKEMMIEALKEIGLEGAGEGAVSAGAGQAVGNSTATTTGGGTAAGGLGAALGSVITFVGWVYLVYQIAMIIIQIIYECTKEELTLGVDRELKKCSYVGTYCASKILGMCAETRDSYCCYPSPLGRIIVEQGTKQLGRDQGTAKAPQCDGLTIAEIDQIDWDQMDLSEWVGMLTEHDLFKDESNVDIDSLTGAGTTLDIQGGNRLNAVDRTLERFKDQNVDEARQINANRFVAPTGAPK